LCLFTYVLHRGDHLGELVFDSLGSFSFRFS
jgi:hypothetical protein